MRKDFHFYAAVWSGQTGKESSELVGGFLQGRTYKRTEHCRYFDFHGAYDFGFVVAKGVEIDGYAHRHGRALGLHNNAVGGTLGGTKGDSANLRCSDYDRIFGKRYITYSLAFGFGHTVQFLLHGAEVTEFLCKDSGGYAHH